MDQSFWHQRWADHDIGFHLSAVNPQLVKHIGRLSLSKGDRLFLPLCGKTLDIAWLLSQGYRVAGAELSEKAIEQLFSELKVTPQISDLGKLLHYRSEGLDIFVGDVFELNRNTLGPVQAVYDRAALVALPEEMRIRYAKHLWQITDAAKQLLVTFENDQSAMNGPPFSVPRDSVERYYADHYTLTELSRSSVPGGLKGTVKAEEVVWVLGEGLA